MTKKTDHQVSERNERRKMNLPLFIEHFSLDPQVTYLNHGSLGLCPKMVWNKVHEWEKKIEANPVQFFDRDLPDYYHQACSILGRFVGCSANSLLLVENATYAINYVLQGLRFDPGDEILISDHEYGAYERLWERLEKRDRVKVVTQHVPLPVQSEDEVFDAYVSGISPRTKLLFFSHISSRTALCFPAKKICQLAREKGVISVVDGAHAPGQIELDVASVGADFYTGNCHKWLFGARPCGFLYVSDAFKNVLQPLVVSWGKQSPKASPDSFRSDNVWLGTRDFTRVLTISDGIEFFETHGFSEIRKHCRELAVEAQQRFSNLFGLAPLYPARQGLFAQMVAFALPECDPDALQEHLAEHYGIEVSSGKWRELAVMRLCLQCYNSCEDLEKLQAALCEIFGI